MKKELSISLLILMAFFSLAVFHKATAQTEDKSVYWIENNFRVIEAMGENGGTVIAPMAQIEAHGPHLPVGTDYFIVREIASRAAKISGAIVGPPLLLGNCSEFSSWPGYILVDNPTFRSIIKNYCRSIEDHGFKKLIFLVEHSGANLKGIRMAVEEYKQDNPGLVILVKTTEMLLGKNIVKLRKPNFDMDTSIMLAIQPDLVKMDKLPEKLNLKPSAEGQSLAEIAPDALFVLPTDSTQEEGEELLKVVVNNLIKLIID